MELYMDPDGSLASYIMVLLALILVNAFFSMSETSIISLNDNKIRKLAASGNKKAGILVELVDKPSEFLTTIQVGLTVSGFLASAVAADAFTRRIIYLLTEAGYGQYELFIRIVSLVVITLVISFFTLALGGLFPKRIAMRHYDSIALWAASPLRFIYKLERPFVALLSITTNGLLRLVGIDPKEQAEEVTEEEIRMMIDVGEESGHIEQSDKDMINNIFEFDDRTVEEMMTHRTEVTAVEVGTSLEDTVSLAIESGYSRIPVYEDDLDSIVGILYAKDLLRFVKTDCNGEFNVLDHVRSPLYVPESLNGKTLLKEFKEKKIQMAVVVDEFGGTAGLVTMEDLIESIVGNIQDEYDDEEEEISALDENRFLIDGLAALEDVAKYFSMEIPDEDDFDTIGGYIVNKLGYIPDEEEFPSVMVFDILFTVREMDDRRVAKLEAERLTSSAPGEKENEETTA